MHRFRHIVSKRWSLKEFRIFLCKIYALIFCRKYQTTWSTAKGRGVIRGRGKMRGWARGGRGWGFEVLFFFLKIV